MATGGGDFGYEDPDLDRDLDHDGDNDDDEQEVDTTRPFKPGRASTPYQWGEQHEMQTMQHEQSGLPDTSYDETPLIPHHVESMEERLRNLRRNSNISLLDIRNVPTNITSDILSPEDQEKEIQNVKDFIKKRILKTQKQKLLLLKNKRSRKRKNKHESANSGQAFLKKKTEISTMQERLNDTRTFDELREQEDELKRQNEEDQKIIEDENASPSEKQAAEDRVAERTEELARLQTQIAERERAPPLRERIKEIFKKMA
ncbi:hypothetical protein ACROYT_G005438 [Oculina patagonica]